ncbi:T9SS C-terminal target domain-containing protein [Sinomicrobium pectinilyticum]|uniref:T9SS C-terminal target domain-containing protein n=1 Tax=Sinomicrobium pectinilyticum TaxID=1084421 RepID=A0A3N0EZW9_SINP1|nr:zinc-dependent metalloprotease family protein [Sinomicrobium pectinilyticum]RNL93426.1 T9SS C-terminal target domain-containing protein [Sinomicrobium pectinilyticum]
MIKKLLLIAFALCLFAGYGQNPVWNPTNGAGKSKILPNKAHLSSGKTYTLDIKSLKRSLRNAPLRGQATGRSNTILEFPDSEGKMEKFRVYEAPVMHPALAARYPEIKSYAGQGIDDPSAKIRFSISHLGLHSMKLSGDHGSVFIEPYSEDRKDYIVYDRKKSKAMSGFECTVRDGVIRRTGATAGRNADDGILRTYRLALSATGEYTQYFGGTKEDALAAMNTTMTRVNGLFENDFAITTVLIENTDEVIYTDPDSDPYTGNYNSQLQNTLTSVIGEENYDIGHVFVQGSNNGNAGCIGCVCVDNSKGSGFTSHSIPEGDNFDVDFVAHEMGHQFGANHTFAIRDEGTDAHFEPGSGSTIMGYAGITGATDIQPHSDPYFHAFSIEQVTNYVKTTTCQTDTPTGNNTPTADAGPDYTIPKGTPFTLTGTGTDADSDDELTYCWEQMDEDDALNPFPSATATSGPVFRSITPSTSKTRFFPAVSTILEGNTSSQWETVPEVARELNFRLTVRDNRAGGAANNSDDLTLSVSGEAGPFMVTSHDAPANIASGSTQTVTWDVAGTNTGDINVQAVDILFATSDNFSELIPLASNVENNGSHEITFPDNVNTDNGRIVIRAVDNIFFAVSKGDLAVREFALAFENTDFIACKPDDLEFSFTYQASPGFAGEVTFSATDIPEGADVSFEPAVATETETEVNVIVSGIDSISAGSYAFTITGTSEEDLTDQREITVEVHDSGELGTVSLTAPYNASDVNTGITLQWEEVPDIQSYTVQVATDEDFSSVLDEASVTDPHYSPQGLEYDLTYYWRVKIIGFCGEGEYSETFYFHTSTSAPSCDMTENNTPVIIDNTTANTVTSTIEVTGTGQLTDLSVGLNISHTYVSDLTVSLTSPSGTTVVILEGVCGGSEDINASFSDTGSPLECSSTAPAVSGNIQPQELFEVFQGENIEGTWTLTVEDGFALDGGALNSFSLDICSEPPSPDLPADNFALKTTSETCRGNQDGSISVEAIEISDYQAVITAEDGTEITGSFQYFWETAGLDAGNYTMCITVDGYPNYEQCFDLTISQPEALAVLSAVNEASRTLELELRGGELYTIQLNGMTTQTSEGKISLDLEPGENELTVKTGKDCQGEYHEKIYIAPDDVVVYPNPFRETTRVFIGNAIEGDIHISVFSLTGKLVMTQNYSRNNGGSEFELQASDLVPGVYLIKIEGKQFKKTFKMVKL